MRLSYGTSLGLTRRDPSRDNGRVIVGSVGRARETQSQADHFHFFLGNLPCSFGVPGTQAEITAG